jgi:hypothetical protein
MWIRTLALMCLLPASPACASDVSDIVKLFDSVCIESDNPLVAAEQSSTSSGWAKNAKLSGPQSASATQAINTNTWDLRGMTFHGRLAISTIQDKNGSYQLCAISVDHFDDPTLETALAARLNLGAPIQRSVNGPTIQSTWAGDEKSNLGVWYLSQRLAAGSGVQIGIAKRQQNGP